METKYDAMMPNNKRSEEEMGKLFFY